MSTSDLDSRLMQQVCLFRELHVGKFADDHPLVTVASLYSTSHRDPPCHASRTPRHLLRSKTPDRIKGGARTRRNPAFPFVCWTCDLTRKLSNTNLHIWDADPHAFWGNPTNHSGGPLQPPVNCTCSTSTRKAVTVSFAYPSAWHLLSSN